MLEQFVCGNLNVAQRVHERLRRCLELGIVRGVVIAQAREICGARAHKEAVLLGGERERIRLRIEPLERRHSPLARQLEQSKRLAYRQVAVGQRNLIAKTA